MIGLGLHIAKSGVVVKNYFPPDDPVVWYNEQSISDGVFQPAVVYSDLSGNGFHIDQSDATKQPTVYPQTYSAGTAKVLKFTEDSLINGNLPVLNGNTDFTMIYAGANLFNYHTAIYVGDDLTPDDTSSFMLGRASNVNLMLRGWLGEGVSGEYVTNIPFGQNGFKDIAYAYKKGTDSSDIYLGIDDGSNVNETQFGVAGLDLSFGDGIGIGTSNPDDPALTDTGSNNWYLFEVLIYNRALTEKELSDTRMYLRKKWNV